MLRTKQEVDEYASEILSQAVNEKEKNLRLYTIAKSYYRIREYETAKKYLQNYLHFCQDADGFKFMGDILSIMGEEEKALEFYKNSFELTKHKQLPVLERICDLLHTEAGKNESEESKERWFGLQKSAISRPMTSWIPPPTTKCGTSGRYSPNLTPPSKELFGPPKTKLALNLMNGITNDTNNISPKRVSNAQTQAGDSPTSRLNHSHLYPKTIDIQKQYMEQACDEVMSKLVEQNCEIFDQLKALTDEFKEFKEATKRNLLELGVRIGLQESSPGRSMISMRPAHEFHASFNSPTNRPNLAAHTSPKIGFQQFPNQNHGIYPQMFIPQNSPDFMTFTNPYYASLSAMYTGAANSLPQNGEARYLPISPVQPRIGYMQQFNNVGLSPTASAQLCFQNNPRFGIPTWVSRFGSTPPNTPKYQQQQIAQTRAILDPICNNVNNFSEISNVATITDADSKIGPRVSSEKKKQSFTFGDFDGHPFSFGTFGMQSTDTALERCKGQDALEQQDGDGELASESILSTQRQIYSQPKKDFNRLYKQSEDDLWECPDCYLVNNNSQVECQACCGEKPGPHIPGKELNTTPKRLVAFEFRTTSNEDEQFTFGIQKSTIIADADIKSNATFKLPGTEPYLLGGSRLSTSINDNTEFSVLAPESGGGGSNDHQQKEEKDEFIPTAEFSPVIPLPPLVEEMLGGEEEIVVHQTRVKLFRFDSTVKEWKEKGVGDLKIMQEKSQPSKARVFMWREQVKKIACNHRIIPELSVSFHKQNLKTLTWAANDFSDGTETPELFVCKFGNEKLCADFKTALENMVKAIRSSSVAEKSQEITIDNSSSYTTCSGCDGCEPDNFDFSKLENRQLHTYPQQTMTPEELRDQYLQLSSDNDKPTLIPESKDISNINPFESIKIQSATGFADLVKQGVVSGFSGGFKPLASNATAVFGGRFASFSKELADQTNSNEEPEAEREEPEFIPTAEFTPVIPLPPLVQVKKGDEDEITIYEVRAKLFRLDSAAKEWKERGIGNMKILQDKADPTKVRLLMWRDQVEKVACNHRVLPGLTVSPHMNSTKALKWSANDFSEEIEKPEVFACKFANDKLCEEFKGHLQRMIDFVENEGSRAMPASDVKTSTADRSLCQVETSSPQNSMDKSTICTEKESESESDDNDDEEEEDNILFEGKCQLLIKNVHDNDFKDLGNGTGHIYYDNETCVYRFSFTTKDDEIPVDHCIVADTDLEASGNFSYTWNAINETATKYGKCQLHGIFLDEDCFGEFWVRMSESSYEADRAEITEQYVLNQLGL